MTRKVYKSAMGKAVDLGALLLQNEHVRAVGNMNVNARGDLLDGANKVIEQKNRQVQRQYQRSATNVSSDAPVHSSTRNAKQAAVDEQNLKSVDDDIFSELPLSIPQSVEPVTAPEPVAEEVVSGGGGLAAAIARSRLIKQEKELTPRERAQQQALKKI
jgi:hypothetical protein